MMMTESLPAKKASNVITLMECKCWSALYVGVAWRVEIILSFSLIEGAAICRKKSFKRQKTVIY
jgi:hypothetical protein